MIQWNDAAAIYLHRDPVDFRKSINGLSVIVEEAMGLSPFDAGLFVFCNRRRDKLKVLYWDQGITGDRPRFFSSCQFKSIGLL